jgi:glutathione synthase/RimK-type ligase-like ATP-grasp enzyme
MILVISHPADPHAGAVIAELGRLGEEVHLIDLSELPERASITLDYADPGGPQILWAANGHQIDLAPARSVWWRRPQFPDLASVTDADVHSFTANEWQEAINGVWQLIGGRWMNPPALDEVASRKALQLQIASELGLRVPRTLMTSDPDRARAFIEEREGAATIFKTFSCTHAVWRETRLVGDDELAQLDAVRLAPVIFQEYVPGGADLRVTVVAGRLFPAAIDSSDTDYPVDFRMSLGQAETEATTLPEPVGDALLALVDRLGLVYGAIDLRRTPEGEHVFLEINTAGEFLFVEERTGLPITRAVADWLASPA